MKAFLIVTFVFAAFGFPGTSFAQNTNQSFEPIHQSFIAPFVDQGADDPEFSAFRNRLLEAVRARDVEGVISLTAPDISLGWSEDASEVTGDLEQFRMDLTGIYNGVRGSQRVTDNYWRELERVLTLGGVFTSANEKTVFHAPFSINSYPTRDFNFELYGYDRGEFDEIWHEFHVISEDAFLLSAPTNTHEMEVQLHFGEVVFLLSAFKTAEYLKILRTNGQVGYVHETDIRRWFNFDAMFEKIDGEWKMTSFMHDLA